MIGLMKFSYGGLSIEKTLQYNQPTFYPWVFTISFYYSLLRDGGHAY